MLNKNLYENVRKGMYSRFESPEFPHDENEESQLVQEIQAWKECSRDIYYRSLLNPEVHGSKIPSRLPVASAIASLHDNFSITPNANGMFCLIIDPFHGTGWLYNDDTVDGHGNHGDPVLLTFNQDTVMIDQWRLVSSSLILKYYGDFNTMSGLFVAATTSNLSAATQETYLDFQNVEDLTNKQVISCSDGVKLIYCPIDEKATDFTDANTYGGTHPCNWQYLFVVIGYMLPNSNSCIRCDYFRNIEFTTIPRYKEYIKQDKEISQEFSVPAVETTVSVAPKAISSRINLDFGTMVKNLIKKVKPGAWRLIEAGVDSLASGSVFGQFFK